MSVVNVVAGVIVSKQNQILLAKRPDHVHKGGLWEFPGGKVEKGESHRQALSRELEEELAICVEKAEPFLQLRHEYSEKTVVLDVWQVTDYSGELKGNEGQPIVWVTPEQLDEYEFPEANQAIIEQLRKTIA